MTIERFDLFDVIFGIGSLLFIMRRLSFKIQRSVVKFNIDNSLMKQLFVVDKPQEELAKIAADGDPTKDVDKVIRGLHEREVYNKDNSYDAWKQCNLLCCCCKRKPTAQDKLY